MLKGVISKRNIVGVLATHPLNSVYFDALCVSCCLLYPLYEYYIIVYI